MRPAVSATRARQAGQVWRVLTQSGGLRALTRDRPRSVTSYLLVSAVRSRVPAVGAVVDVGANTGQFARAVASQWPGVAICSIEADPDAAAIARRNLADVPAWQVIETAVGDHVGTATLRRHAYSPSSSLLPVTPAYEQAYGRSPDERLVQVPMSTLDELLTSSDLPRPWLLKLDVQGLEAQVLRGATTTLGRCSHVLVEVSFIGAYAGEAAFEEVHDLLVSAGLRLDAPLDVLRGMAGEITQADFLYASAR